MKRKIYQAGLLRCVPGILPMLVMAVLVFSVIPSAGGGLEGQKIFPSAGEAVDALVAALKESNGEDLPAILGPGSEDLVFSGDEVADRNGRMRFLKAYEEMNRLERESENRMVLIVGSREYPFPVPLIRRGASWLFDARAGREEILHRRIGGNELHTIEVMQAYTDAQREYACMQRGNGSGFARRLTSSEGRRDGLYWEAGEGEAQSPFGPLLARAAREGYSGNFDEVPPEPFHGYYFKILTKQGVHANGGAFDYVADGKMVLGFALAAYPAKYGVSGIMTFIVNQEGVIYEKDLGFDTETQASAMTAFDPDDTWTMYGEGTDQ